MARFARFALPLGVGFGVLAGLASCAVPTLSNLLGCDTEGCIEPQTSPPNGEPDSGAVTYTMPPFMNADSGPSAPKADSGAKDSGSADARSDATTDSGVVDSGV